MGSIHRSLILQRNLITVNQLYSDLKNNWIAQESRYLDYKIQQETEKAQQ